MLINQVDIKGGFLGMWPYLEHYTGKDCRPTKRIGRHDRQNESKCGRYAVVSECESGQHHFAKKIICRQEWCPDCGKVDSAAHNRRKARLLKKIMQIESMGYFVIEFPRRYRRLGSAGINPDGGAGKMWCYSKKDLIDTTNRIIKVLAGRHTKNNWRAGGFYDRGLLRWHWFGDEDKSKGRYNPHANVIVDSGWLPAERIELIKAALRAELNVPDLIVHYSYTQEPAKMFHILSYVTRATFLKREWNSYMAAELYNFRNQRYWGKWIQPQSWDVKDISGEEKIELLETFDLQKGICPDCGRSLRTLYENEDGKPIKWTRPIDTTWITAIWDGKEIADSGYYRIPLESWLAGSYPAKELLTEYDTMIQAGKRPGNRRRNERRKQPG